MAKVLTTCIYCGCGCGLYLQSENGVVCGSYPSSNHPVSQGAPYLFFQSTKEISRKRKGNIKN